MATTRSVRFLAAGFTASLALVAASPAAAQTPSPTATPGIIKGSAFAASIRLAGEEVLKPTPQVTLPADGTRQEKKVFDLFLPGLLDAAALRAETKGVQNSGTSEATGEVADVQVLPAPGGVLPSLLSAKVISATCNADPDGATGSATVTNATLSSGQTLDVSPNTKLTVPNVADIFVNEQTKSADGRSITVNAIRIVLLPGALAGNDGLEIILGSASCGPNSAAKDINAIPTAGLPIAAGIVAAFVIGVVVMRRRETGLFAA